MGGRAQEQLAVGTSSRPALPHGGAGSTRRSRATARGARSEARGAKSAKQRGQSEPGGPHDMVLGLLCVAPGVHPEDAWDERIDAACCPYPEHDPRDYNWPYSHLQYSEVVPDVVGSFVPMTELNVSFPTGAIADYGKPVAPASSRSNLAGAKAHATRRRPRWRWSIRTCCRATRRSTASGCTGSSTSRATTRGAARRSPRTRRRTGAVRGRAPPPARAPRHLRAVGAAGAARAARRGRGDPRPPARAARPSEALRAGAPAPPASARPHHRPHRPHARPAAGLP